jgi:hypothetical protein
MLTRFFVVTLLASLSVGVAADQCRTSIGAIVPDANTARQIAVAVIAAHQKPENSEKFELEVEPDGDSSWSAYQYIPPATGRNGEIIVTEGGGGLSMKIDRCTGAISQVYYQR